MTEFLQQIAAACVPILCALITAGGTYLIVLLRKKTAQLQQEVDNKTANKYISMACDAVSQAVAFTAQTYVDALKADDAFTKERQLEAFTMAKDKALQILGGTAIAALNEIYGDLDLWLTTKIEQECRAINAPTAVESAAAVAYIAATVANKTE